MLNIIGFIGSPIQMIVIAVIAFLLFGNRLPSVMRSVGRSVTEFKKGVAGVEEEIDSASKETTKKAKTAEEETEE